jgi:hypothetical protein
VEPRSRILAFGSCGVLTLAGILCGALINGLTGQVLAIGLILLGLGGALLLVFYEVGLSEDRALAEEEEQRRSRDSRRAEAARRWRLRRPPRRPG